MGKKYADYMNEISADDLYKGLLAFGLISNKIPPVFSSTPFFDYCVNSNVSFSNDDHDYVRTPFTEKWLKYILAFTHFRFL